mmetsp:Transcript_23457/g.61668  ORF Transcript_23457/g.61668 Transcript_23457/m.61668 type:complete len:223 (+) Transcript_23457:726-1394(+)
MTHYHVQLVQGTIQSSGCLSCHILVRSTVETIASDSVLFIETLGHRIAVGFRRHGRMECSVKDCNVRDFEDLLGRGNPQQMRRIVQWRQGDELFNLTFRLRIDERGLCIPGPAVHHPMAHDLDIGDVLHGPLVCKESDNFVQRLPVVRHRPLYLLCVCSYRVLDDRAIKTNFVHKPAAHTGERSLRLRLKQTVLQARTATVQNQHLNLAHDTKAQNSASKVP